jgi:type II secretory pathway component HofQ
MLFVCAGAIAAPLKRVTLDVKDADVHVVLKSIQTQCGIPNLIVDPGVTGSGTFLFHDLPCDVALRIVLKTTGLAAKSYSGSIVAVHSR